MEKSVRDVLPTRMEVAFVAPWRRGEPNENVLGFGTKATDWAGWEFEVAKAGVYEVEIQQII